MTIPRALSIIPCLSVSAAMAADFKKDIRPILKAKCYECHNAGMKQPKAGYVFDDLEKLANDIGPKGQIVPGDPERSNILELVTRTDKDRMPPGNKEPLTPKEIKLLREWIEEGASLDSAASGGKPSSGLQPRPQEPAAPIQDWTNTDGKTVKARFVRLSGESVVIKTADGKMFKVPLNKLSPASQEQAKTAAAAGAKATP